MTMAEVSKAIESLLSERVRSAPGPFFPAPSVPTRFNFDQGVPAPESYPIDDLARYAARAITEGGTAACEYAAGGNEEMGKGYIGLRKVLADRISARDGRAFTKDNVLLANGSSTRCRSCPPPCSTRATGWSSRPCPTPSCCRTWPPGGR